MNFQTLLHDILAKEDTIYFLYSNIPLGVKAKTTLSNYLYVFMNIQINQFKLSNSFPVYQNLGVTVTQK